MVENIESFITNIEPYLLSNKVIPIVGVGLLKQPTYGEMLDIGLNTYYEFLNYFLIGYSDDLLFNTFSKEEFTTFKYLVSVCKQSQEHRKRIEMAFSLFFNENAGFLLNSFFIGEYSEGRLIYEDQFKLIQAVLLKMHGVKQEKTIVYESKLAEEWAKKIEQMRDKYKDINMEKEDGISLQDMISAVCARHPSINLLNVEQLSIYQIKNQFARLVNIDNFEINIESLMHGASQDEVQNKHWSSKIEE